MSIISQMPWAKIFTFSIVVAILLFALKVVNTNSIFTIEQVALSGPMSNEQRAAMYEVLQEPQLRKLPMKAIHLELQGVEWVREVTIGRAWPDVLNVWVSPEKPIALWNDDAYLNEDGQVFYSEFVNQARLPQLYGPVGEHEVVMEQYLQLNSMLFSVGQQINQLVLDDRGNWKLQSDLGIEVLLGKTALMDRVKRLIQVTEFIESEHGLERIKQIDSRYVNGVAVAWKPEMAVSSKASQEAEMKLATNYNSQRESKL